MFMYHRCWLLSTCAYNLWQQVNMCLTKKNVMGSVCLIKGLGHGMQDQQMNMPRRFQRHDVQNDGQEVNREHVSQSLSTVVTTSLQPLHHD